MTFGDSRGVAWFTGLAILFGLAVSESQRFERAVAADIALRLEGRAKRVRVRARFDTSRQLSVVTIHARDFRTDQLPLFAESQREGLGELDELTLRLERFRLAGLDVERLDAVIPDCRYDLGLALRHRQIRLQSSGVGIGSVTVSQDALGPWITSRFREIKSATVRLDRHHVEVTGEAEFLVAKARFRVIAELGIESSNRIVLSNARIWMDDRPAEPLARAALLDLLNPVVDLNRDLKLFDAIRMTELRIGRGRLTALGTVRIPTQPTETTK